jgi:hypothetical protein
LPKEDVPPAAPNPQPEVPQPAPVDPPKPASTFVPPGAPSTAKKPDIAKIDNKQKKNKPIPAGVAGIIEMAKHQASNAGQWIQSHPLQAGLIGTGVAITSLVLGWIIFRALKGGKSKSEKNQRNHARSIDIIDAIKSEFPANSVQKRAIMDEIDWDDEEFLEFMKLLPDLSDLVESQME